MTWPNTSKLYNFQYEIIYTNVHLLSQSAAHAHATSFDHNGADATLCLIQLIHSFVRQSATIISECIVLGGTVSQAKWIVGIGRGGNW